MGRIIAEIVGDKLIVTKYDSNGFVIPDKITQDRKIISIIRGNLDKDISKTQDVLDDKDYAVTREEFLVKILSMGSECVERYSKFGKGLYSEKDMKKGITWSEVAYLVHYVLGLPNSIDWNTIKPSKNDRVCVVHEIVSGDKVLDERLASYKSRLDMENYIGSIVSGKRYIPLPMYFSFVDLLNNPGLETDLSIDMMFKKVSRAEFELLF